MNKTQSGLALIVVGITMNTIGRLFSRTADLFGAGVQAIWMFASVVLVLFGVFRLVVGLSAKNPSSKGQ